MFKISFEFDEVRKTVRNLKCEPIKEEHLEVNSNGKPIVEVEENKLLLSPEVIQLLGISPGDRVSINYTQLSNELTMPLIARSEKFADREAGNKLTKSNTVSFKGKQRTLLLEYGSIFTLKESNTPGVYYLTSVSDDSSTELASSDLSKETEEITEDDFMEYEEIDKLPF